MRKDNANWTASLRRLKAQRPARGAVREERLKTLNLHYGPSVLPLSAWRGDSGRRYVVGVHPALSVEAVVADETRSVVIIAVRRPDIGEAEIVDARDAVPGSVQSWLDAVIQSGANELHVHRLADTEAERLAILADLLPALAEAAQATGAFDPAPAA